MVTFEKPVSITYRNYRAETAERVITPQRVWFGSTEWHPEPQWLLTAFDHEKQANRDFALKDFGYPKPSPRAQALEEAAKIAETYIGGEYEAQGRAAEEIASELRALSSQPVADAPFQDRVKPWMLACFGEEISNDKLERCDRFIEEALELVQAIGYSTERAQALVDYVFNRDIGEPHQEAGGVMVTLAALCLASGLDMNKAGEDELARIWTKVEKIRAKQAAKPTGSALPIALPLSPEASE